MWEGGGTGLICIFINIVLIFIFFWIAFLVRI
jgi:hypothetical protein